MPKVQLKASIQAQFVGFPGTELSWGKGETLQSLAFCKMVFDKVELV